jgi:hypothetical protein
VFEELARQGVKVGACRAFLTGSNGLSRGVVLGISSPEAVLGELRGG